MSLAYLLSLISLGGYGFGDFLTKRSVQKVGYFRLQFMMALVSISIAVIFGIFLFQPSRFSWNWPVLGLLVLGEILNISAYLIYNRGAERGLLSLISPISAGYPIIPIFFGLIFLRENPGLLAGSGVFLIILGLILASIILDKTKHIKASIFYGLAALVLWGISTITVLAPIETFGPRNVIVMSAPLAFLYVVIFGLATRQKFLIRRREKGFWVTFLVAFFEMIGGFAFLFAVDRGHIAIVAPISAAYPLITVFLSLLIYKEKLNSFQWFGVPLIILGIVLMAF